MKTGGKHSEETKQKISESGKGRFFSKESRKKLSIAKTGINSPFFSGYYITPWGKYPSSILASTKYVFHSTIRRWCKNADKQITQISISNSKYLSALKNCP